ncbi:MAG TPA: AIR synthase-related protein [Candidatus Limnocylindrales bacterium]|nr:AIR synthase-related protein [Candidatus Limnocylindrales bacterium]
MVERERIVTGAETKPRDRILGLASSGIHSNGFSLARKVFFERLRLRVGDPIPGVGRSVADELLEPTRIYVKSVLPVLDAARIVAMTHVTGGGITENLPRVLPDGTRAFIDRASWPVPPVFAAIRAGGGVDEAEMRRTFNMGIGFLVVAPPDGADRAAAMLRAAGERVFEIGEIRAGLRGVEYV